MATVLEELVVSLKYQVTGAKTAENIAKNVAKATNSIGMAASRVGNQLTKASGQWAKAFGRWGSSFKMAQKEVVKGTDEGVGSVAKLSAAWSALLAIGAVAWARGQANELMDVASQLNKISNELGISTDAVQELNYAAIDADISIEDLQTGMRGLSRGVLAASRGSKEAAQNFSGIGVSIKDLADLDAGAQFELMADRIAAIEDPSTRTATAMRIFGRSGATLLPLLNQGGEGIKALREEFKRLGGGLTSDAIDTLGDLEKNIKMMNASMLSFKASLVTLFVPAFVKVQRMFSAFEHQVMDLNKKAGILQVVGIAGLVVGFYKLYKVMNSLSSGSVLKDLLGLGKWMLLGTVIAGIAILIQDIYTGLTGGKSKIFEWIDAWAGLGTVDSWIRNILAGLKEIERLGTFGALKDAWQGMKDKLSGDGALQGTADGLRQVINTLERAPEKAGIDVSTEQGRAVQAEMIRQKRAQLIQTLDQIGGPRKGDATLRALGRGVGAAVQGAGQVTEVLGQEVPAPVRAAAPTSGPVNVQINPVVNAKTTANAAELEQLMQRAVRDGGNQAARNIAAAAGKR
jgi:hypothetical protein